MTDFSPELIERCIKHFSDENGVEMTKEEAAEALENLAGLYLAFSNVA